MLLVALALLSSSADDGFGGAPAASAASVPSECSVRTADGRWISCAEAVAQKELERRIAEETRAEAPGADSTEAAAPPPPTVEEPPARVPTDLETELVGQGYDPKLPILALRIHVAELERELDALVQRGYGTGRRTELEAELAREKQVASDVEFVALSLMLECSRRNGMEFRLKRVEMTPAGPVYLTMQQLIAQIPRADPFPCGRLWLVEQQHIDRVRRAHEVYRLLKRNPFGYRELEERRRTEAELAELDKWLADHGVPALKDRLDR